MYYGWKIKVNEYDSHEQEYEEAAFWATQNQGEIQVQEITGENYYVLVSLADKTFTYEEVRQKRAELYAIEVDPLTSQISRLRDEPETPELLAEIDALIVQRAEIVARIKEENPYPEGSEESVPEVEEVPEVETEAEAPIEDVIDELLAK